MDETIIQPYNLNISLYPHQLKTIYMMEKLEREKHVNNPDFGVIKTNTGINGNFTGYGKTLEMVGLLVRDKMNWIKGDKPYYRKVINFTTIENNVLCKSISIYQRVNANLILVSSSILFQWINELKYSEMKVLVLDKRIKISKSTLEDIKNIDVVLIIPSMFNDLVIKYKNVAWKRFLFDEPSQINVSKMRPVIAKFYWFITATPELLYEKHCYCKSSYMNRLIDGTGNLNYYKFFTYITIQHSKKYLNQSYTMPKVNHYKYYCYDNTYFIVKNIASNIVQQMISAGNIKGAITALGGKSTDNIVELLHNKFDKTLKEIDLKLLLNPNDSKLLEKKEKITEKITTLQDRYKNILSLPCSICLDTITKPVMETNCQNIFCGECIMMWLSNADNCPLCRNKITQDTIVHIEQELNEPQKSQPNQKLTKINTLLNILDNLSKNQGKIIIFSSWDESLNVISKALDNKSYSYVEVKGTPLTREKQINKYKNDVNILLLNTVHNGFGINLENTTDVIFYHKTNEHFQVQMIGRANRLGRTKELNVHHLLY